MIHNQEGNIKNVSWLRMEKYLLSKGWERMSSSNEYRFIDGEEQFFISRDEESSNDDIISILSDVENRSKNEVALDICMDCF